MANNTAGAPAGGEGFRATGAGKGQKTHCMNTYSNSWRLNVCVLRVSPAVEFFLGCFGAVYWNESFP